MRHHYKRRVENPEYGIFYNNWGGKDERFNSDVTSLVESRAPIGALDFRNLLWTDIPSGDTITLPRHSPRTQQALDLALGLRSWPDVPISLEAAESDRYFIICAATQQEAREFLSLRFKAYRLDQLI